MNVLFVLENHYPNIGGVETLFKTLTEALVAQGHQVRIVTTQLENTVRKETLNGVEIVRYPFYSRYIFTFFAVFPIMSHMRWADVVHTTSYNAGLPAFIASKLFGKKIIITFHEVWNKLWFKLPYMNPISTYLHYLFEQMLVRLPFNYFVGVSQSTADSLRAAGVAPKRIIVNYNGIDYDEVAQKNKAFPLNPPKKFTYTYCGRLGMSKGINLILEAAQTFRQTHPDSVLKMIIPKNPKAFFETILKEIEDKGLSDYVVLKHHLSYDELITELKSSSCLVVPSYSEGFCFMAVECIALGVPLISSDQMALREVVSGKFLKMKEHSTQALLDTLELAYQDKWENTPIKKFELDTSVQNYIEMYEGLKILS